MHLNYTGTARALYVSAICVALTIYANRVVATGPDRSVDLNTHKWLHGSQDCKSNVNPPIQVVKAAANSYILRQDKCLSFEAPFMYLLIGNQTALLLDTGDVEDARVFPLYETVKMLVAQHELDPNKTLVLHSHGHLDHRKGDVQFHGKEDVEIVGVEVEDLIARFDFKDWPYLPAEYDLGGRLITLIPTPGHHKASITVFDSETGWLLTGDTLYPGNIRIHSWKSFRASINRLRSFVENLQVTGVLGGHIEIKDTRGELYPAGSTFQPNEAPLALSIDDLVVLQEKLAISKRSQKLKFHHFVVSPLSWLEKRLSQAMKVVSGN